MLACLRGGKAVLCEKPFTINAGQALQVINESRSAGRFVMEAMWTRFVPAVVALREQLASGAIGRVRMIVGGGAFVPDPAGHPYILNKQLGGGALLDAGVYLVSIASMILGTPSRIQASGVIGEHGVDEQEAIVLDHADGATALLYLSLRSRRSPDLEILGERGRIRVHAPVFIPPALTLVSRDGSERTLEFPRTRSGYEHQIREVMAALRESRHESAVMPLSETLSIMQTMDRIRAAIGLRYAGET
jgi:predicted dehydrogenase